VKMHDDQIDVPDAVAAALIAEQFPQWADEPVLRVTSGGTVNTIFRIGDELTARFPLHAGDPEEVREWLEDEVRSATEFARCSPVPAPVPIAVGNPGPGFPLPWMVQTWIPGDVASEGDVSASAGFALELAGLIRALRTVGTAGRRFHGLGRGGDMGVGDALVETSIRRCAPFMDVTGWDQLWARFLDLPRTAPDVMSHGDLIPGNVLVRGDHLVGVLDGGSFGPADPALDVIAGWHLLESGPRTLFRNELQCDDLEWERSRGWAFQQAAGLAGYYADTNPAMYAVGRQTLRRIFEDVT
jgi:aminoglycoside phosphotransferase (APT) family kinase protein